MSLRPLLLLPAAFALAACASQPPADATAGTCNADAAQAHVGKPATEANIDAAFKASGAKTLRSLKANQPMTLDYREDRVNVIQGDDGKIERITCG